jgi:hypothetical protein
MRLGLKLLAIAVLAILAIMLYVCYRFNVIDLKDFVTWTMAGVMIEVVGGLIGYLLAKREKSEVQAQEIGKAIAEETQKLREREKAIQMHRDSIYNEIVKLLNKSSILEVQGSTDWLAYPQPEEELASHLEAYGALGIVKEAKVLCEDFNADLDTAINYTKSEFEELVTRKGFSMQRWNNVSYLPERFYSPDLFVWDIYHRLERFQAYVIQPVDGRNGWFKIGNTVASTDNRNEIELFTEFVNDYALKKLALFNAIYKRRVEAIEKIKEFFNALREIRKTLDSGHPLQGQCYLCP